MESESDEYGNDHSSDERLQFKIVWEISMVGSWAIWTPRNEVIFDGMPLSLRRWKHIFKDEFGVILHRAKPS